MNNYWLEQAEKERIVNGTRFINQRFLNEANELDWSNLRKLGILEPFERKLSRVEMAALMEGQRLVNEIKEM